MKTRLSARLFLAALLVCLTAGCAVSANSSAPPSLSQPVSEPAESFSLAPTLPSAAALSEPAESPAPVSSEPLRESAEPSEPSAAPSVQTPVQSDEVTLTLSGDALTAGQFLIAAVQGYTGGQSLWLRYSDLPSKVFPTFRSGELLYGFAPVSSTTDDVGRLQLFERSGDTVTVLAEQTVTLLDRTFERQDLTVASGSSMETAGSSSNLDNDKAIIEQATAESADSLLFTGAFVLPARGRISTQYGMRRYTNGKYSSAHSGYDIAADAGTPVVAAASGKIAWAGEMKFYGNTVIIDHGCDIFSFYNHMSDLAVETGQTVTTGQAIGTVGSTGYSTGPHLHFNIKVANVNVDPAVFLDTDAIFLQLERMITR